MILFINACVRAGSRTKRLADRLLSALGGQVEEIRLDAFSFPVVDETYLEKRERCVLARDFGHPLLEPAARFSKADEIVIASPLWDLSFPAVLKRYLELVNVVGVTFRYTAAGVPEGLCRAKRLFYVTTAGGDIVPDEYGFGYIRALAQTFYGIRDVRLIKAIGLDLAGADPESIIQQTMEQIDAVYGRMTDGQPEEPAGGQCETP